jgi:ParB-like nuclease domain
MSHRYANLPIEQVRANPKNARTHSKKQIRQIANSIQKLGFGAPILVDECLVVIRWARSIRSFPITRKGIDSGHRY